MEDIQTAGGPLGWQVDILFAVAVATPQIVAAALYLGARAAPPDARARFAPVPAATLVFAATQAWLGLPASQLAPALVAWAVAGLALIGVGRAAIGREWRAAGIALGLMVWAALLAAPARVLGLDAGLGPLFALLTGCAALAAHWPCLAAAYAAPGREPPLPWFLWSAGHGGWALLAMAAGVPWPLLVFPFVAQAVTFGIGLFALEGGAGDPAAGERAAR